MRLLRPVSPRHTSARPMQDGYLCSTSCSSTLERPTLSLVRTPAASMHPFESDQRYGANKQSDHRVIGLAVLDRRRLGSLETRVGAYDDVLLSQGSQSSRS